MALQAKGGISRDKREVSSPIGEVIRNAGDFSAIYFHLDQIAEMSGVERNIDQ